MSLKSLLSSGKLRRQKTSAREIADLFDLADRDLKDASIIELSPDRRFATAYNAVLPLLLGEDFKERADYFDSCRAKRNTTDYGRVGDVSESEATELLREARQFRNEMAEWVSAKQ